MNIFRVIDTTYGRSALQLVRRHERCSKKLARFSNHLTFLTRCIKNSVIPKDLRVRSPIPSRAGQRIADNTSRRFLRERIHITRIALDSIKDELGRTTQQVKDALAEEHSCVVLECNSNSYRVEFDKCKTRQQEKYSKLIEPRRDTRLHSVSDTWVVNLSGRELTPDESAILSKGLNFAVAPKRVPATEIIAKVESCVRTLDAETVATVRKDVNAILTAAEPPKSNITSGMRKALKSLKDDSSVTILPADKGRATVVLDTDTYRNKMSDLLESGPYRAVKKDPTERLTRKLSTILRDHHKNDRIDDFVYRKIKPSQKQPPRIYGLPKIHKPSVPLRPIVSCVNSFAYNTSKFLAELLAPLLGSNGHAVRDSASFVDFLRAETIHEHEVMVSFDVVSLFTNVPIEAACHAAFLRLESDTTLPARTKLSPAQVVDLLKFVLQSTYFMYNGGFYEQQEGAAMGSPVSAVIANLFMESFEEQALKDCPPDCTPRIWKRYVDDTFIVVDSPAAEKLLDYMNAQVSSIRFTMEKEVDSSIAFLDTLVHRTPDSRFVTTVYRKPTHTDQYLAYDSHHPNSVKRGVVKCLFDRAARIVTKPSCTATEKQHVASALVSNGYPSSFIKRATKKKTSSTLDPAQHKATVVLPFVDSISRQLRRCLAKHGVRTVFQSGTTLRNQLVRPKDPALPERRDGVVYRIPCTACDKVYIGETGRPVGERMTEHRRDVRLGRTDNSAVAEHAWNSDHHPNWDEVHCIAQDKHWYTRRVKEAIQIRLHPTNINRDNGVDFPEEWLPTIRRHAPPSRPGPPGGSATVRSTPPTNSNTPPPPTASASPSASPCGVVRDSPIAQANHSAAVALTNSSAPEISAAPLVARSSRRYITRAQQRSSAHLDKD